MDLRESKQQIFEDKLKSHSSVNFHVIEKHIWLVAILVICLSWFWSFHHGYVLTYNDAASHLNIARRIVDNLTPGLSQIGTVWLPLPHLLMLLTVWNNFMWHSGLAGSIVSMASYVLTVVFVWKLIRLLTKNTLAAIAGALIVGTNPNFLYLSTTPMTEPLFLAGATLAVYALAKYITTKSIANLLQCGLSVLATTLVRYDGWFFFASIAVMLYSWGWVTRGRKKAEGALVLFLSIGGFGIVVWLLWNQAIFGDALYFMRGPYSALSQQNVIRSAGQLPTAGHIVTSLSYYGWAMVDSIGWAISVVTVASLAALVWFLRKSATWIILAALATPFVFNVLALYFGQSGLNIPQAAINPGLFNTRYGLLVIPAMAVIIGLAASYRKFVWIAMMAVVVQFGLFAYQGTPIVLADGLKGLATTSYTVEASHWLAQHYQGGLILTSLASHDAFVARTGLPMRTYVHEGTRQYWTNALAKPSASVNYIAMMSYPPDTVYKAISKLPDFTEHFILVYQYGKFGIYQRR